MTQAKFTTLLRFGLLALFFLSVGASAALLLGEVARCLNG